MRLARWELRWRRIGLVTVVYLLARLITLGFLLLTSVLAEPGSRFGAEGGIDRFIVGWDANWYAIIGTGGYPDTLPLTDDGQVAENAWAFMPVYPAIVRLLAPLVGSWAATASIVSLLAGLAASIALFRLLGRRIGERAALWAVAFFACGPVAAMFHVGYAEALFLALLFAALDALARRAYWWLYALVPLMAFTRPGVLAFALALGLLLVWRLLRRSRDPLRRSEIVHTLIIGPLAAALGFAWQWIAAGVTGQPGAYLATELAWRRNWIPDAAGGFAPFEGWAQGMGFWFGYWRIPAVIGWALFAVIIAATVWALLRARPVRALGAEARLFSASYLLYLLAVFFPQSSTLRLLLPLSPLWGSLAAYRLRAWRPLMLMVCLAWQWWWIFTMYGLGMTVTQIP